MAAKKQKNCFLVFALPYFYRRGVIRIFREQRGLGGGAPRGGGKGVRSAFIRSGRTRSRVLKRKALSHCGGRALLWVSRGAHCAIYLPEDSDRVSFRSGHVIIPRN